MECAADPVLHGSAMGEATEEAALIFERPWPWMAVQIGKKLPSGKHQVNENEESIVSALVIIA